MELADLVSTALNKAQSASNYLVINQNEKAELALESLCEFLNKEMLKPEAQPAAEREAAETPAGEQPEKSQEQVTEKAAVNEEDKPQSPEVSQPQAHSVPLEDQK